MYRPSIGRFCRARKAEEFSLLLLIIFFKSSTFDDARVFRSKTSRKQSPVRDEFYYVWYWTFAMAWRELDTRPPSSSRRKLLRTRMTCYLDNDNTYSKTCFGLKLTMKIYSTINGMFSLNLNYLFIVFHVKVINKTLSDCVPFSTLQCFNITSFSPRLLVRQKKICGESTIFSCRMQIYLDTNWFLFDEITNIVCQIIQIHIFYNLLILGNRHFEFL